MPFYSSLIHMYSVLTCAKAYDTLHSIVFSQFVVFLSTSCMLPWHHVNFGFLSSSLYSDNITVDCFPSSNLQNHKLSIFLSWTLQQLWTKNLHHHKSCKYQLQLVLLYQLKLSWVKLEEREVIQQADILRVCWRGMIILFNCFIIYAYMWTHLYWDHGW